MIASLVERCTFPAAGSPLVCAVSGGPDSLALLVLAVAAGCSVTAVHVDHGLRAGSEAEGEVVADAARRLGAAFRSRAGGGRARPQPRGPGPGRPPPGARARRRPPGTRPTTRPRPSSSTCCGAPASTGWRPCGPGPTHPILSLRRCGDGRALPSTLGLEPVRDPTNDDPRFVRNRVRHELLPLCSAIAGRDVVPVLARQADGHGR